ncbi:DMT family transporter [Alkalibacillus salilacus]|uniref:Drug/metabolite transporter (DMT)-like permease n=1 Tax=Alkalibacillus salilacus TaxID=284582 RepID=A0ABT9VHS2_9BACI|nr:DMT family transporter [Alkalibacillus salilacus]MDQ0160503.1 drug/metabolite transporter (DMT)-like permease [Alkalibacillus salilacus]
MWKIYSLLFLVMFMWGMNLSSIKVLVEAVDPLLLNSFRVFTAGVAVLIICMFLGIFRFPKKSEWTVMAYIGAFNVVLHHAFIAIGLEGTSGVNGSLILGLVPLITVLMSVIFLKQKVNVLRMIGFLLGFSGVALTTLTGDGGLGSLSYGDVFVFLGVVVQGFSFVLISKLKADFDPRLITGYMMVFGSFFIFIISQVLGANIGEMTRVIDWHLGSVFLFSAICATAFGHMTYNLAIKKVGPAETAIFTNLNTLFAIIGSAVFLGEVIMAEHIIGFVLIIIGIFFGTGAMEYFLKKRRGKLV